MINDFLSNRQRKSLANFLLTGLILALSLLQPLAVFACGMSMIPSASSSGWTYGNDSAEQSFINYENGIEHLIISRSFENGSADTVWVIPVPATPTSVNVDVLSEDPKFSGYDVIAKAKGNIKTIKDGLLSTQIYPIIPIILSSTFGISNSVDSKSFVSLGIPQSAGSPSGVDVYEHIEKNGMTAEVLSATDSDALYAYLKEKGLNAEKNSISILQDYIGKNFSFVATWVSSSTEKVQAKGVLMQFPTDKIFYPLKPESGTPGNGFPETITVVGHVTPNLYANIKNSTYVDYYHSYGSSDLAGFFSSKGDFNYTKIVINTAPKNLIDDLYISQKTPLKAMLATSLSQYTLAYFLLLLLIISLLSSYLASLLLLADKRFSTVAKMTIASCFTLIGTIIGSRLFLQEKRFKFVVLFSITFIVLTFVSSFLLSAVI